MWKATNGKHESIRLTDLVLGKGCQKPYNINAKFI